MGIGENDVRKDFVAQILIEELRGVAYRFAIICESERYFINMNKPMPITIYGIKNCDTMKKARAWLDGYGVEYAFHDYKVAGIDTEKLERWAKKVGWETLLNRAGMTFRKLPEKDKKVSTAAKAIALMRAQPSLIKRPVIELGGGKMLVGFKPELYQDALDARR